MKFAEHLSAHITPEWRKQYINYEDMKGMLYEAIENADAEEDEDIKCKYAQFDDFFFRYCEIELTKINVFFSEKLSEATRKFASLKSELIVPIAPPMKKSAAAASKSTMSLHHMGNVGVGGRVQLPARKMQDLKLAFTEFYLSLVLLQNYQNLNFTGFRKILKKHDKLLCTMNGAQWRMEFVENAPFYINSDIAKLITETEETFTTYIEGGDRQKAMKRLRVPPLGEQQSPWVTFKVGFFWGSFLILCIACVIIVVKGGHFDLVFRLYRPPLIIVAFLFLIGVNIYGWRSSGVNHVLIFELDPRNHLGEQHLMEFSGILGVVTCTSLLLFQYWIPYTNLAYLSPLVLMLMIAVILMNPLPICHHGSTFWLLRVMGRIFCAPFFMVAFADFWLADQLNSLTILFTDFHYTFFFFYNNDLLSKNSKGSKGINTSFVEPEWSRLMVNCIPAWIRFAQCLRRYHSEGRKAFPHLANAGKYASSILSIVTLSLYNSNKSDYRGMNENPFFFGYVMAATFSSLYAYAWDIKMDWGLFDSSATEYKFLREEIVYPSTALYYLAIVEDLILRFMWLPMAIACDKEYLSPEILTSLAAFLEVFRRFVWNFFRLENEHLNNCGQFRAVRDISVAPAPGFSDPSDIIRIMDGDDGPINRRHKYERSGKNALLQVDDRLPLMQNALPTSGDFLLRSK